MVKRLRKVSHESAALLLGRLNLSVGIFQLSQREIQNQLYLAQLHVCCVYIYVLTYFINQTDF